MTKPDGNDTNDEILPRDILRPLLGYRNFLLRATLGVTAAAAIVSGMYLFLWQPTRSTASLGFRPTFPEAADATYPNGLPFSSTDIVNSSILGSVFDKNKLQDYCSRADFQAGFVVNESSPKLAFLDLEYQSRLADARLTQMDRDRLQNEYNAKRQSLPREYNLVWVRADACKDVPRAVVGKVMPEILQTWAEDADEKRGVMKLRVSVLTPMVFDFSGVQEQSLMIRADLIRSALTRVIANIIKVEQLPGAEQVHYGERSVSLAQIRLRLEDLTKVYLDPLISIAGRAFGVESIRWVEEALAQAQTQQQIAEERADAYQLALQQYSGATPPAATGTDKSRSSADVQALTPQIDRTFIEGIVQLSAANTTYRQGLTDKMVKARIDSVDLNSVVEHYKRLLASLRATSAASSLTTAEVTKRMELIVAEVKDQVRQFDELYAEFSRVSLRSAPTMFQVTSPTDFATTRPFSKTSYLLLILATLLGTPIVLAVGCLVHYRIKQA